MRLLLAFLTICCFSLGYAQSDWATLMEDEEVGFYEVQAAFDSYWETHEVQKGKGFKQFKRWEYFMEPRVYPSGQRFGADAASKAMKGYLRNHPQAKSLQGDWSYVGNDDVPSNGGAGRINAVRVHPTDANTLFACAPAGGLWKSTDQGNSWSTLTESLEHIGTTDVLIDPTNPQIIYLATGDGDAGDTYSLGVLKSTDGGATWAATGLNWSYSQARRISKLIMHPTDNDILWAATSNGVFMTTDAGLNWSQTQTGNFKDLEIHPSNPSILYAAGSSLYRSTDGGVSFSQVTSGLPASGVTRYALGVSPAQSAYVYAIAGGASGFVGLYRSTNSGASFTQRSSAPNLLGYLSNGSDTGGQAWYDLAIAVDPNNANTVYTGGVNIWKSTSGGQSWSLSAHWTGSGGAAYVHADIHSLDIVNGQLYAGCDGGIFRSSNGGSSYTDISDGLEIAQLYRLGTSQTQADLVISGWQDNGTNLKNGNTWTRPIGGDGMECIIDYTSASIMYGEVYYGSIGKSTNGGATFSNIVSSSGTGVNSQGSWVTPYVMDPSNHNTLYVGKQDIYKSTTGGSSWSTLSTPSNSLIDELAIAPSNSDYIYYSANNLFYRSSNGGADFTQHSLDLPDLFISYIAVSDTDPEKIWVSFSGFVNNEKVYASTDGGDSWENISNGLPNVPTSSIVYQNGSNDGLYIGTDVGVFYRNGVYESWQPFFSGMPNVIVSELEINYFTNTIYAATFGRGLWQSDLFSTFSLDAGIGEIVSPQSSLCDSEVTPQVRVQNFGDQVLNSAVINYRMDEDELTTLNWAGSLSTGESEVVNLPTQSLSGGQHNFEVYLTSPNGGTDEFSNNDLIAIEFNIATEELVFELISDAYGEETTWEIVDEEGQQVASGGPYTSAPVNGEYPQSGVEICLPTGCFDFVIYDSYGDGICCAYGNGSWVLRTVEGEVLASDNSVWTNDFTASFCLEAAVGCTGDLNSDGIVDITDFLLFNSAFGQNCSGCAADFNTDGTVDVADFILLNSAFGQSCQGGVQEGGNESESQNGQTR